MPTSPEQVVAFAAAMIETHASARRRDGRLGRVERYLKGDHDLPYMPRGAKAEYRALAKKSITNWLPLISDTFAKALWVDGYRPAKSADNAKPWDYWQANRLDARQSIPVRSALDYGVGYVSVLPGDSDPAIRCMTALKAQAFYEDDDDEWPVHALVHKGRAADGSFLYEFLDDANVYALRVPKDGKPKDVEIVGEPAAHDLGVCPVVRFRDRLDGEATGIIAPHINLQDRINESVFSLMVALQFASFRQRWATGLAIPLDESPFLDAQGQPTTVDTGTPNPNFGKSIEPFQAAVDRLWVTDSPEAKFGDFAQTEVSGHLQTYESTVKTLAAHAQIPPAVLMAQMDNLAAEAIAAVNDTTTKKAAELETIFGEAWEQVLRLAAAAAGDEKAASDTAAQVRWRDTEARSLAQTVDALGKLAQMLQVPVEALWERVPGVTDQDVQSWKVLASKADGMAAIAAALSRQSTPVPPPAGAPTPPAAPPAAPGA